MTMTVKLCSAKANGVMQRAKRAFIADKSAAAARKSAKKETVIFGGWTACNIATTVGYTCIGDAYSAAFLGLASAFTGISFGMNLKEFMQASKARKALNNIVKNKEFQDIMNRFLRIKGKENITVKQIMAKLKNDKTKVKYITANSTENPKVPEKTAFYIQLNAAKK